MSNAVSGQSHGDRGISAPGPRPDYKSYKSPYAPQYTIGRNFHGVNNRKFLLFGSMMTMFGGVAGIAALFFFSDIPRVRMDIMQKIPIIGERYHKEVPPEDNPF